MQGLKQAPSASRNPEKQRTRRYPKYVSHDACRVRTKHTGRNKQHYPLCETLLVVGVHVARCYWEQRYTDEE